MASQFPKITTREDQDPCDTICVLEQMGKISGAVLRELAPWQPAHLREREASNIMNTGPATQRVAARVYRALFVLCVAFRIWR